MNLCPSPSLGERMQLRSLSGKIRSAGPDVRPPGAGYAGMQSAGWQFEAS